MYRKRNINILLSLVICLSGTVSLSCKQKSVAGKLIITQVPGGSEPLNTHTGDDWRYLTGAQIAVVDPHKPNLVKVLTGDFYSACSPDISPDYKTMFFAAQQKENDPWQIWEMDLTNYKSRKVLSFEDNCTDPVFLPTGRLVFSKSVSGGPAKTGHSLFNCNADGSDVRQITFHPHADFATSILRDGRLLSLTRQILPEPADPYLMVMRPDGTKAGLFYRSMRGGIVLSRGRQSADGKIFFIESDSSDSKRMNVISINYNRPLFSRENLTGEIPGNFSAVFPRSNGELLVSYQKDKQMPFAVYVFNVKDKKLGELIYNPEDLNITEIIYVEKRDLPKKLPSEVDMGVKTGLLLCQNINFIDLGLPQSPAFRKADKIEVIGIDSSMGVVQVEDDGSFYLKVVADQAFQIRTLDDRGNVVNGSSGWLWLRPNERRGCVGCHENHELAPENIVPLSVKKAPINIPVQISKVHEKEVELE